MDAKTIVARLQAHDAIAGQPGLAQVGGAAFELAKVLLEDEDNLTRMGNPTGEARATLRARIEELLAAGGDELDAVDLEGFEP